MRGSRSISPAPTAASARSCAARSTASCRSWSRRCRGQVQGMGGAAEGQEDAGEPRRPRPTRTRPTPLDELKAQGEKVYGKTCVACHQPNGQGMPPAFPALVGRQDRHRAARRAHRHRGQRQQEEPGHGGVEEPAVGPGDRRRHHLRAQLVRQQDRRHGAAEGHRGSCASRRHYSPAAIRI